MRLRMAAQMERLEDLHNPDNVTSFLHKNGTHYILGENQAFQIYPKSIELWELKHNRLFRVRRWLDKSIIAYYN